MSLTNDEILQGIDSALKDITDVGQFGNSLLQPGKLARFVREMLHPTKILPVARYIPMGVHQEEIDRIAFPHRILRSGATGNGTHRNLETEEFATPSFATNILTAQELQAIASLRDRALRRNIERGGFENTLITLFGEAAGRDMEEYALLADTNIPYGEDDVLSKTDGWVKKSANKLYGRNGSGGAGDFDVDAETWPRNMLQAMIEALPKQYLGDVSDWRFYVTWEVRDALQNWYQDRGTDLGDRALTENMPLTYKGFRVEYVPMLGRSSAVDLTETEEVTRDRVEGDVALLAHPDNMAWGVFHEVSIEREREAKARRTDFVLTFEGDAGYEDENASVVALIDKARP